MENRQKILDAAARLYGEAGFRGATTRRIAIEAGVNEVTLFRIFGSKASLLAEAVRCCSPALAETPALPEEPRDPEAELTAWAEGHLTHLRENAPLIRTMLCEVDERPEIAARVGENPRAANCELRAYVERLRLARRIDPDVPTSSAVAMLTGCLFADVMGRPLIPDALPPEGSAAREYVRLFLRAVGLRARPARQNREKLQKRPSRR